MSIQSTEPKRIAIVGTGLLGGSIGLGLRAAEWNSTLVGVGRRQATLDRAIELGCIDEASLDLTEAASSCDLIILATPLGSFGHLLQQVAKADLTDTVITDVGSTKQQVCREATELLGPAAACFVGSHPMAGSEKRGPDHARADLFQNAPCIITAAEQTDPNALAMVENLWATLGMNIIQMPADQHDQQAARVSHLPHAVAVLLVTMANKLGGLDIASSGFRDTTRIAAGDPTIWLDIFTTNRQAVLDALDVMGQELADLRQLLASDDTQGLAGLLKDAKQVRDSWRKTST
jgi:prephenate dehydrogenase